MFLFMTFKAFYMIQIFRVINLVDSFARRQRVFKDIEFLIFNKFVNLI